MPQLLFGGIIAIVLLGFYIWSIIDAVSVIQCAEKAIDLAKCADPAKIVQCKQEAIEIARCDSFSINMSFVLNSIGGLISATVVGVLGATQRGNFPAQESFGKGLDGYIKTFTKYMPSIFILVWIVCGVITVIYGFMLYDNDFVPPLSAHAKVWIGTAIASVYAYLGINPDPPVIAKVILAPPSITLTAAVSEQTITATAADAQDIIIPNVPNTKYQWTSDTPSVATVDQKGTVTRVAIGKCSVKASANNNTIISNECVVTCT